MTNHAAVAIDAGVARCTQSAEALMVVVGFVVILGFAILPWIWWPRRPLSKAPFGPAATLAPVGESGRLPRQLAVVSLSTAIVCSGLFELLTSDALIDPWGCFFYSARYAGLLLLVFALWTICRANSASRSFAPLAATGLVAGLGLLLWAFLVIRGLNDALDTQPPQPIEVSGAKVAWVRGHKGAYSYQFQFRSADQRLGDTKALALTDWDAQQVYVPTSGPKAGHYVVSLHAGGLGFAWIAL